MRSVGTRPVLDGRHTAGTRFGRTSKTRKGDAEVIIERRAIPALLAAVVLAAGCKEKTTLSKAPAKLVVVSGDAQSALGQAALAAPLVVRVTDPQDAPVANVTITWAASDPTAQLTPATSTTDASG